MLRRPFCLLPMLALGAVAVSAQPLVRVPGDASLQQAIDSVNDGGVIEIAAGTYAAPENGFSIRRERKSFTLRAASGAEVILDGEGSHTVLRIEDTGADLGRQIALEGLTFANGLATSESVAGALTITSANVIARDCLFRDSASQAPTTGGGAVRILSSSKVRFENTDFLDNSATNRGGAIEVQSSELEVSGGSLSGNGGGASSIGGAIFGNSATVTVADATFEQNEAGLDAGAIFLLDSPAEVDGSEFVGNRGTRLGGALTSLSSGGLGVGTHLDLSDSRFEDNSCVRAGGALYLSDRRAEIRGTSFVGNSAEEGGAIFLQSSSLGMASRLGPDDSLPAGFRAEISSSTFERNHAERTGGGAFVRDSELFLTNTTWTENTAVSLGGAVALVDSSLEDRSGTYRDNGVDLPGSPASAAGGAIDGKDSQVDLSGSTFEGNRALSIGGAIHLAGGSLTATSATWVGNASNRGGGLSLLEGAGATVSGSTFSGNRVNEEGHDVSASGGAIDVVNGTLDVDRSTFENNEAAASGGAISLIGQWSDEVTGPRASASIRNSSFQGNRLAPHPCCEGSGFRTGGAIAVVDQARLEVFGSRFLENLANVGGAIHGYRTEIDLQQSIFRGNVAEETDLIGGTGGALTVGSIDLPDASTEFGGRNRPTSRLTVSNSLFQGAFGGTADTANFGGCLFAEGDFNSLFGVEGMQQDGSDADNRATVVLDQVTFVDCSTTEEKNGDSLGGAIGANIVDLTLRDLLVANSHARGDGGIGGGLLVFSPSRVVVSDTTFAFNSAETAAGMAILGSELTVEDSVFFENEVSPGTSEAANQSRGAAIFTAPTFSSTSPERNRDATGVVEDSVFVGNVGIALYEEDRSSGAVNRTQYNGNSFRETSFGNGVFFNGVAVNSPRSVAQLNGLNISHSGASAADKSTVPNVQLSGAPDLGALVAAPSLIFPNVPPGESAPAEAFLGYAWSGSEAELADMDLAEQSGVVAVTEAGEYELRVDGAVLDRATVEKDSLCAGGDSALCLNGERFEVEVEWRDFRNNTGDGQVVPFGSDDSGLFFFFDADNWEMLVKVVSGCGINQHFWVFAAATTNVEYTLRVTDTATGLTESYFNPLGVSASAITDTEAFATCDASSLTGESPPIRVRPRELGSDHTALGLGGPSSCVEGAESMCLNGERFQVEVDWRDFSGNTGEGQVVPFGSDDSGLFFFFDADNWEMLVKVISGCGFNQHYWVFAAATTNVEYTLRVTDTLTGATSDYFNTLGQASPAITDTEAFATCP